MTFLWIFYYKPFEERGQKIHKKGRIAAAGERYYCVKNRYIPIYGTGDIYKQVIGTNYYNEFSVLLQYRKEEIK